MNVVSVSDLPASNFSHELVGDDHGGLDLSIIFVDAEPGRGPSRHRHDYAEVLIVQEGEVTATVDDETRTLHAGDVAIVPAGAWHSFENTGTVRLKQIDLHLNGRFVTDWHER